jgi:hypothetical protein
MQNSIDDNLFDTTSTNDIRPSRTSELDEYCRPIKTNENGDLLEPERSAQKRLIRYCNSCNYSSDVVSNFRKHLKNSHHITISPKSSEIHQIAQSIQDLSIRSCTSITLDQKLFDIHLTRLIVTRNLPFSCTEWPEFHALLRLLNPDAEQYLRTSHNSIQPLIRTTWNDQKRIICEWLAVAKSQIHISVDIWTSPNSYLFLGIVAFFVQENDDKITKLLLGLPQIGSHGGEEQFRVLIQVLEDYRIDHTIGFFIGDNSTTNDVLCRTMSTWLLDEHEINWDPNHYRLRCLGHMVNLIVQAFLFSTISIEELESYDKKEQEEDHIHDSETETRAQFRTMGVLGKVHNITVHIRGSASRTNEFVKEAGKRIPLDNRTRWNSWFSMIDRACSLESHIDFYTKNQLDLKQDTLGRNDWEMLRTIRNFLQLCQSITVQNEGDQNNISETFPSLVILWSNCKTQIQRIKAIKVYNIFRTK